MTWEELKEKAIELGYTCIKERTEELRKKHESCNIIFIRESGNVVVDIPFPSAIYSGILCERTSIDKMYQIILALR